MSANRTRIYPRLKHLQKLYGRTLALALAMAGGLLIPQAHGLSFLIPYLLVIMLFFAFLDLNLSRQSFNQGVVWIVVANLGIASLGYLVLAPVDHTLALVAFITGATPTATAAPVVVSFLNGRVEYVVAAVLLTNVCMAIVLPFVLPLVVGAQIALSPWEILQSVLLVIFVPLGLARGVAYLPAAPQQLLRRGKPFSFYFWLVALGLITAKAADFIFQDLAASALTLGQIALVALVICIVNFGVGALLGGRRYRREASQALGQKNTSLTIWLALTFINPLVALGPTFYVVYHNLYNSFQLYRYEKKRLDPP